MRLHRQPSRHGTCTFLALLPDKRNCFIITSFLVPMRTSLQGGPQAPAHPYLFCLCAVPHSGSIILSGAIFCEIFSQHSKGCYSKCSGHSCLLRQKHLKMRVSLFSASFWECRKHCANGSTNFVTLGSISYLNYHRNKGVVKLFLATALVVTVDAK